MTSTTTWTCVFCNTTNALDGQPCRNQACRSPAPVPAAQTDPTEELADRVYDALNRFPLECHLAQLTGIFAWLRLSVYSRASRGVTVDLPPGPVQPLAQEISNIVDRDIESRPRTWANLARICGVLAFIEMSVFMQGTDRLPRQHP